MCNSDKLFALSDQVEDIQGAVMAVSDSIDTLVDFLEKKVGEKPVLMEEQDSSDCSWWQKYECRYSEYYITSVPCIITNKGDS